MPIGHFNHNWQVRRDTGVTVYEECPVCRRRQAYQRGTGNAESIDRQWIATGTWSGSTPPQRPRVVRPVAQPDPIDAFQSQRRSRP